MKIYIVVEIERDSMNRTNCAVYLTEDEANAYHEEIDECAGGGLYEWEIEEWDIGATTKED